MWPSYRLTLDSPLGRHREDKLEQPQALLVDNREHEEQVVDGEEEAAEALRINHRPVPLRVCPMANPI